LSEALAVAEGKEAEARIHQVEVPAVDVAAIRASTGLTRRVRAQYWRCQGHAAQLGAWPPTSHPPGTGATRDDRQEAFAGERVAALLIRVPPTKTTSTVRTPIPKICPTFTYFWK
jgi:hypothetical protein